MESVQDLSNAILVYEQQLCEVRSAVQQARPKERLELESLEASILELLQLTRQNLEAAIQQQEKHKTLQEHPAPPSNTELDAEYALFKAELAGLEDVDQDPSGSSQVVLSPEGTDTFDIQEELVELLGSKCQAPFTNKLEVINYYNALVLSVHAPQTASDLHQIQVRVMFINPTEREMVPCPYYLDGACKFSDGKCNYSHGYLVPFSQLREYKEPDFSRIRVGCHVLAKLPDNQLWVSTCVQDILSEDSVSIKQGGVSFVVPLHDLLPFAPAQGEEESNDEENEISDVEDARLSEAALERSLTDPLGSSRKFGEWEQHTKGIGSKLMAKMGYIVGAGLGKCGEGRLEPVEAIILPPGKSLDHCMNLREKAGSSKDLFSVERLQKRLSAKALRRSAQLYKKKTQEEQSNVFNIINSMTTVVPQAAQLNGEEVTSRSFKKRLESASERHLNVEKVKTEEMIGSIAQDIYFLDNKLSTKKEGSLEYKHFASKLGTAKAQLEKLERKNDKIAWEIKMRETKKKMIF